MNNWLALLSGVVIVVLFSYERFNRTTDEAGQQLYRLVSLLSPNKLRSRRVVLNAYLFYASTFLLIYLFLCAYAELIPALGGPDLAIGATKLPPSSVPPIDPLGGYKTIETAGTLIETIFKQQLSSSANEDARSFSIDVDSATSFGVALMIVGLAPSFPVLQRFEAWMRGAAHRLAGIPTRVLDIRDDLRGETLSLPLAENDTIPGDTLLIPYLDWERMLHYRKETNDKRLVSEDFHDDITLIFAVSDWIIDRKLKLSNQKEREEFNQLEKELGSRKQRLVEALDDVTGFQKTRQPNGNPVDASLPDPDANPGERPVSWDQLAEDADNLADDMRILLAVYIEQEIIVAERFQGTHSALAAQRGLARAKLEGYLKEHLSDPAGPARSGSYTVTSGVWASCVILLITLIWSIFPGSFESRLQMGFYSDPYLRALNYVATAFAAYCIPLASALALRDGWKQSKRWRNMCIADWTVVLPQAAAVFLTAWGLAIIFLLGAALWHTGVTRGWNQNAENVWSTLRYSLTYNAPTPVRGAVLAIGLVFLLDAWRAPRWRSYLTRRFNLIIALGAAFVLGLVGGLTRWLSCWAGALQAAVPRERLDGIDHGLIVYATLYSAVLGFFVVLCVSEVLHNQRRRPWLEHSDKG
ncbi:hypothetical protein [Rhizobium leguminosarum]|uniref:Putative integral membrane protein n=1 Tax=Rhizobium leguminosarum TaxID=384 RepID=A0A2Z4YVQ2_RHILE|nr:hypothetical protein [Rhizobium leguminosarum]AXA44625.1 putative integral membrane protein [Rhizobium leguminosarum]